MRLSRAIESSTSRPVSRRETKRTDQKSRKVFQFSQLFSTIENYHENIQSFLVWINTNFVFEIPKVDKYSIPYFKTECGNHPLLTFFTA